MSLQDALDEYNQSQAAFKLARKLMIQARNTLLEVMGISSRYTTLGTTSDEREMVWRKSDVDYNQGLSPSMRRRMRMLKASVK